jgi:hypothetical protein
MLNRGTTKELITEYDEIELNLKELKYSTSVQLTKRSKIVEQLFQILGNKPFKHNNIVYTISKRLNKSTLEDTYFLKSPSDIDVEYIKE